MKKISLLFLCLFIFIGCTPVPETELTETKVTVQDTKASPDPDVTFISDIINQSQPVVTSAITEETDEYTINVQFPKFENHAALNELIENNAISDVDLFKKQVAELAIDEDIEETFKDFNRSYFETYYSIIRNDEKVISILFENQDYSAGAAHPMTYSTTINWDVQNEKAIEWIDVIPGDQDIPAILSEMVKPKIYQRLETEETDEWIEEGAGPDPLNFLSYTIGLDEIMIYFDPYQVAAYAVGPVRINLSFEELGVLLNPELIPAEN